MSLLQLDAESDTFSVSNNSFNGSSTDQLGPVEIVVSISSFVCFILLTLILVFKVFYICRYKTTFLQRLFFYFTIATAITEAIQVSYFGYIHVLCGSSPNKIIFTVEYFMIPQYHGFFIELLLIGSISVTLLSKMYKHRASRQAPDPNTEYMLCCCAHKKSREITFCLIVFIATLILPLLQITASIIDDGAQFNLNPHLIDYLPYLFILIVLVLDIVMTMISVIVLITWLCRRRNLLPNKVKVVCREISLVVGFMAVFIAISTVFVVVICVLIFKFDNIGVDLLWVLILFPFSHCIAPLMFLVYICNSPHRQRREAQRQKKAITANYTTAPPSTRVSLLTDTADHAPNFLSPSTAEPTEVTPLLGNNTIQ